MSLPRVYEYTRGLFSTKVFIDNADQCVFFNTEFPTWATADEKDEFLAMAEEDVLAAVDKEYKYA